MKPDGYRSVVGFAGLPVSSMQMSVRAKHITLVLAAQIFCVTLGLWMHNRYVVSSVYHSAEQEAWKVLAGHGDLLMSAIVAADNGRPNSNGQSLDRVKELLLTTELGLQDKVILVDAGWRILTARPESSPSSEEWATEGRAIEWKPAPDFPGELAQGIAGRMATPLGPYIAIAFPVAGGGGFVTVSRSVTSIRESTGETTGALKLAGVMAVGWTCALLGISIYLIISRFCDGVDQRLADTETRTLKRIQSLVRTRDAVIFGLAKLADSRDPETGDHLERISVYSSMLASALKHHPKYSETVTPTFVRLIGIGSALHDIGKVGIADHVLLKPGPLNDEEREEMQRHTTIGTECLKEIEMRLGESNFLLMARDIASAHHERWDGSGYPTGLSGSDIPLSARIVSIADVYDALSSRRVYKPPMPHSQCVEIISAEAGKQFDPDLVEVWLTLADHCRDIAQRYGCGAELVESGPSKDGEAVESLKEPVPIC